MGPAWLPMRAVSDCVCWRIGTIELSKAVARGLFTPRHDRGRVLIDVAMLADGGEAITDIDVLRHQAQVRVPSPRRRRYGGRCTSAPRRGWPTSTRLPAHPSVGANAGQLRNRHHPSMFRLVSGVGNEGRS